MRFILELQINTKRRKNNRLKKCFAFNAHKPCNVSTYDMTWNQKYKKNSFLE
jgi:hypothetical protein